jgi:uncharacterized membrane protein YbhN (UPF0104 family)
VSTVASAPPGIEPDPEPRRARLSAVFAGVFNVVAVGPVRRRPADVTNLIFWLAVLGLVSITANDQRPLGATIADLVADIPSIIQPTLSNLYRWGTLGVVVITLGTALLRRRWRFALALVATWAATIVVGLWLSDGVDLGSRSGSGGSPYPAVRLAFAVGVAVVAGPHVTRPLRRLLLIIVGVACVGAITSGDALVIDVVGGVALGSAIAAVVNLVIGSPLGVPSRQQVIDSLASRGIEVGALETAGRQVWGETRLEGETTDGVPVSVSVIGRDETDARLLSKIWRSVWYREAGGAVALTRASQVEHQGFVLLWAADRGVPVPRLLIAGVGGARDDALLVTERPVGTPMLPLPLPPEPAPGESTAGDDEVGESGATAPVAPAAVSEPVVDAADLDAAWAALGRLHAAGLTHGRLEGKNLVFGDDGSVTLVGVEGATLDAAPIQRDFDSVALLVATALATDDATALGAARRALGDEHLAALLPMLSTAAIPAVESRRRSQLKQRCTSLREAGAELLGVEVPQLEELRRVKPTDIALVIGTLVGVYLLIGQLAGLTWATFAGAAIGWVVLCALVTQLTSVANAFALIGSVSQQELPLRQTTALQFGYKFTGLVGGTVANLALFTRYLQKRGLPVAIAASSAALTSVSQFIAQTVLVVVALLFTRGDFTSRIGGDDSGDGISVGGVLVIIIGIGVLLGVAIGVPRVRNLLARYIRPQWDSAKANLRGVLASPRRAVLLLGGYLCSQLLFALGLDFALRAYGYELSLLDFVVINTVASLLGGIAPVPGGMGVIEAGLIAGLTAAGIPDTEAVAATFTYRAFTAYLPPIWGWASLAWLRRRDLV